MVFFTCNTCGESLKKNQVEKHCLTKCRSCQVLSCVDCGKDFWGDDYLRHTKCISEIEKYSGPNFKPKVNANKGERKQEQWVQQVQSNLTKNEDKLPSKVRHYLTTLQGYDNIPRKKQKFKNFVSNSLRLYDQKVIEQLWDLMAPQKISESQPQPQNDKNIPEVNNVEPSKKSSEEETEGLIAQLEPNQAADLKVTAGSKRPQSTSAENVKKKKKKKKHQSEDSNDAVLGPEIPDQSSQISDVPNSASAKVFSWSAAIESVLRSSKSGELRLKRLQKKVLSEYLATSKSAKSQERFVTKLNRKLSSHPNVKLVGNKVHWSDGDVNVNSADE